jgi:hypothetical protein
MTELESRTPQGRFASGRSGNPEGGRRTKARAAQDEAERNALTAELLQELGRPATARDRIAAANLAALHLRAIRLEANGRDASEVRRQITQTLRASWRPDKVEPKSAGPTLAEYLKENYGKAAAQTDSEDTP